MTFMERMRRSTRRGLTKGERADLSKGLLAALAAAGVEVEIVARAAIPAYIVALWRGRPPVMVLGRRIFWPGATADFSGDPRRMAVLQHELQHVLEFATGALSALGYLFKPRNWTYGYLLTEQAAWADFGAEQRAMIVQHLWLAEHGLLGEAVQPESFRRLIPWAGPIASHIPPNNPEET